MDLLGLCRMLDDEFAVAQNQENLVEWAVTKENEEFVYPDFLGRKTGLMVKGSETVRKVFTAVFVTDNVVRKVSAEENGVLFTHHQFNYYEDERGLQPIAPGSLDTLIRSNNSVYVAHAPLDTHKKYGTSLSLAKLIGVQVDQFFYDYFGAPTALIGHIARMSIDDFANHIQKRLRRPSLTVHKHKPFVERVAILAGAGDVPEILQHAHDYGCDTLLTGTIEHRWGIPIIQKLNKKFHDLNNTLELNLVGGTHFGTERPALLEVLDLFRAYAIPCEYCEDEDLLHAT